MKSKSSRFWDFPGVPVACAYTAGSWGSIRGQGTKILCVRQQSPPPPKKKISRFYCLLVLTSDCFFVLGHQSEKCC